MRLTLPLTLPLVLCATTALSENTPSALAKDGLEKTIAQLVNDPAANGFETGMLMTLRAVEKTFQARYEYGIGNGLTGFPFSRRGARNIQNPNAKPQTPETISKITAHFVDDIAQARLTLEKAEVAGIKPFEMTLQDIWFDVNANGTHDQGEDAFATLGPLILGNRSYGELTKTGDLPQLTIRFDAADHAWLSAYTNMLSGLGNLVMAFDPEPVQRHLAKARAMLANAPQIPNIYDIEQVKAEIAALKVKSADFKELYDAYQAQITAIRAANAELKQKKRASKDVAEQAALQVEIDLKVAERDLLNTELRKVNLSRRFIRNEIRAAESKLPGDGRLVRPDVRDEDRVMLDTLYVAIKALAQDPDPARIRTANADFHAMVKHNRIFWERLGEETDNDHEWIPNPSQDSAMPFDISPELAEGWQNILKDFEATLNGDLLISHPLLPDGYGLSVPAYVANPSGLDLIGWIHGIDAYKYAAKGPRLTSQSWRAFQRLTTGRAGGFALFFN